MKIWIETFILMLGLAFWGLSIVMSAQPAQPRPLSPEFLKRREAGAAFELGRIYLRQQKPLLAAENFTRAAKVYAELRDDGGIACSYLGLGSAYGQNEKNAQASETYEQALAIFRALKGRDLDERSLAKLGFLYDELVGKRAVFKYDELAIQPPKRGYDQNGDRIDTRFSQGSERYYVQYFNQPFTVYYREEPDSIFNDPRMAGSSDQPKPVSFYRDVLSIWKANGVESVVVAVGVSQMEAWADTDPAVAAFYGKQAVNQYQQIRQMMRQSKDVRVRTYNNQLTDKFRFLADLLIGLGRLAEANEVLQMLKEEEFSDFVQRDQTEIKTLGRRATLTAKERALIERYRRLADRAAEIAAELRSVQENVLTMDTDPVAKTPPADEKKKLAKLNSQAADINAAFKLFLEKELVNEIGTNNAAGVAADSSLQSNARDLGPGVVSLYTVVTERRYRVILTTPTIQIDGKTEIDTALLNKKVRRFREALQDTSVDPRPMAKELYDILIKPVEKELAASGAKTLVWSLDGTLRYIPIAALSPDGLTYLAEKYQNVVLTPRTRERLSGNTDDWKALGMGISEEQTVSFPESNGQTMKLEALPGSREELMAIIHDESEPTEKGILAGKRYLDKDFTLDRLKGSLAARNVDGKRKFNVVHLASHFRLGDNWSNSFLFLGNGKVLSLEEIGNSPDIDFSEVELVTLSACNTALTTDSRGFEVDSLAAAIQAKSGKAVLATLWAVYDESTSLLMQSFYRERKDDPRLTKAKALQRAQMKLITGKTNGKSFAHPYFWAGFVLIGNWN